MLIDARSADLPEFYELLDSYGSAITASLLANMVDMTNEPITLAGMVDAFPGTIRATLARMMAHPVDDEAIDRYASAIAGELAADMVSINQHPRVLARIIDCFPLLIRRGLLHMVEEIGRIGEEGG